MLGIDVLEGSMYNLSHPTKFCENPECLAPVGEFPYTTRDGRVFCDALCAYIHDENLDVGDVSCDVECVA